MNPATLLFLEQALAALPQAVAGAATITEAVTAVSTHVNNTMTALKKMQAENRDPSADEWAELAGITNKLLAKLTAA